MTPFESDALTARGTVYPEDCDHMGHMNVASYVRRFDEAAWALWSSVGMTAAAMARDSIGVAALESKVTYRKELFAGDSFAIRSRFVWLKDRTAQFHNRLYVLRDDGQALREHLASTCTYTVACLDRDDHKACVWPDPVAARVRPLLRPIDEEVST